jgi:magnesium chelatase family protein
VRGILALLHTLHEEKNVDEILLPQENAWEAGVLESPKVRLVNNLSEAIDYLKFNKPLQIPETVCNWENIERDFVSFDQIVGQLLAKRALQIAIAGRHHFFCLGSPGVGKSLLASASSSILPPLDRAEAIEILKVVGEREFRSKKIQRPFRSPHHSISTEALLGGGSAGVISPGEVTLSHLGVLFLDEFPEFRRDALEGLREPLETGEIRLHRVGREICLPACFTLIAAMNPCPCGFSLSRSKRCICSNEQVSKYRRRVSGPIFDRFDLSVLFHEPGISKLAGKVGHHESVKQSIDKAWRIQKERYKANHRLFLLNGQAKIHEYPDAFALDVNSKKWLVEWTTGENDSYRSIHKLLKVSRTIADLNGESNIRFEHLQEAWGLRCRNLWSSSS